MPEADQEIKIILTATDAGVVETSKNVQQSMELLKVQMKETALEGEKSFSLINKSMNIERLEELQKSLKRAKAALSDIKAEPGIKETSKVFINAEAAVKKAERSIKEFRAASSEALKEVNQEARQFVQIMKNLQGINLGATRVQFEQQRDATVAFLSAMRGANQATQPFNERLRNIVSNLGEFGQVGKFVFGSVLGITAVTALRRVVDILREAITASLEFQQSVFTLEVAIRGLQRVGIDTTISSWNEQLENFKRQFPIFPRQEFTDAAALAALMTREFGFTEDQIADIVRQSAILSEITGKDLHESVRAITFAIGSGYFESLQRAGVNISRQVVATEALAQGYEGVYNELEPTIRASVTYSVIQNNLNAIQDDAGRIVETTAGQVRGLTAAWQDLQIALGQAVTETDSAKESISGLALVLNTIREILNAINQEREAFNPFNFIQLIPGLSPGTLKNINDGLQIFYDWLVKINALKQPEPILGDLAMQAEDLSKFKIGDVQFSEEEYQAIIDATNELQEEIIEIEEEANKRRIDAITDYQNDIEDLQEKHKQRLLDLEQKYQDRLDDIATKEGQRIADAIADNEFRVAEAIRKAQYRREDAERKYRERELKEERKFQEKMRQLRENFLLDLEDAVRERDARQIIRLIRQYNLRREQMTREEKLNKRDRADAFQEELREIEFQKQERLRQLAVEHQRKLDEIALQAQRERNQAKIDWERQQEEERERRDEAQQERSDRLNEQLDEIREGSQERINEVIKGLQDEYNLTEEQLLAAERLWKQFYGAEGRIAGWVDQGVNYIIARMQQLAQMANALNVMMRTLPYDPIRAEKEYGVPDLRRWEHEYNYAGGQAEGGTIIARKPTVAIFGEAGDEMATFTPLNKIGSQSFGQVPMNGRQSQMGRLALQVLLSPDLEARIIDSTLNEVADVVFTIERERA